MRRQGIGRTQSKELRLALRATRAAYTHARYAKSLHATSWAMGLRLATVLRELGRVERELCALTFHADEVVKPKRRAA